MNDYYIERAEAIRICERLRDKTDNEDMAFALNWAIQSINNIPAADVRPIVRGHWISKKEAEEMDDITKEFTCSVCGCCEWDCTESENFNFCPNCGADMREDPDA